MKKVETELKTEEVLFVTAHIYRGVVRTSSGMMFLKERMLGKSDRDIHWELSSLLSLSQPVPTPTLPSSASSSSSSTSSSLSWALEMIHWLGIERKDKNTLHGQ